MKTFPSLAILVSTLFVVLKAKANNTQYCQWFYYHPSLTTQLRLEYILLGDTPCTLRVPIHPQLVQRPRSPPPPTTTIAMAPS